MELFIAVQYEKGSLSDSGKRVILLDEVKAYLENGWIIHRLPLGKKITDVETILTEEK